MAFIEMTCSCSASFQVELPDNDLLVLAWAQSFVETHKECGFMHNPIRTDYEEKMRRYDVIYKEEREKEL